MATEGQASNAKENLIGAAGLIVLVIFGFWFFADTDRNAVRSCLQRLLEVSQNAGMTAGLEIDLMEVRRAKTVTITDRAHAVDGAAQTISYLADGRKGFIACPR